MSLGNGVIVRLFSSAYHSVVHAEMLARQRHTRRRRASHLPSHQSHDAGNARPHTNKREERVEMGCYRPVRHS